MFFDLVFVFAITRVTDIMVADPTGRSVLHGVLVMAVLWWSWVGYAWLGNVARADEGIVRVVMFAAMGAVFVTAIAIPEAFDDLPGGLYGPLVFAIGYFAVRAIHLAAFWLLSRDDPDLRRQLLRFAPSMVLGTTLLLVASQTTGWVQTSLWIGALVGDYLGTLLGGEGWRLRSVGHFAERHGLIVLVALGESIVAIGIGVASRPVTWGIVVAVLLGLIVSGLLWWAYFDVTMLDAERAFRRARGRRLIRIARNGYSFFHLPMVVGIVLASLGLEIVLEMVADGNHHRLTDPLSGWPLAGLCGGVALYLASVALFRWYVAGTLLTHRLAVAAALVAVLVPLGSAVPALVVLGIVAGVLAVMIGAELVRYDDLRRRIRHPERA
ncbi:low temperature requirement protein A [Rhodococcus rhodnii]|uniref:low temperature requirement protein A n=1 Tax=Rhodococcus rhodnii TaxID=38312 RepID=UPI003530F12D